VACKHHKSDICYLIFILRSVNVLLNLVTNFKNMTKKIIISSLVSVLWLSQAAKAEIKAGPLTLTPGILFQSAYVGEFTGATTNRTQPTYGADINIAHNSGVYIYSAVKKLKNYPDASSIASYGTFDWEWCNSLGLAKSLNSINLDASYENCYVDKKTEENTGSVYLRASYDLNKQTTIGAAYVKDLTGPAKYGSTPVRDVLEDAYKAYISHDLGLAKATVTYGQSDNFTEFYTLGLNKEFLGVNFDLTYWNVSAENFVNTTQPKLYDRELAVLSVKKTF
jgi:hypothetical protein